jgi:hypothetical protein
MVGDLMQDNAFAHCPTLVGWDGDDAIAVMRAGTAFAVSYLNGRDSSGTGDFGGVSDDIVETAETKLHWNIDRRAEEINSTTSIKERRPLVLRAVDGAAMGVSTVERHEPLGQRG